VSARAGVPASPFEDWAGVAHPADAAPRIACLVPSLTETLFALGLGRHVVARTGFCIHPRTEVRAVAKVGGTKNPDLQHLAALAPTHLVVNVDENRREDVDAARAFVPHVVVTHPRAPDDNRRLVMLLGAIFARQREASALADEIDAALAELRRRCAALPPERVLYLIWRKPWMGIARETYIAATLAAACWETLPATATARYPELADDHAAWREADRILLSTEPYAFRERDAAAIAAERGRPACLIDGEWTSWYGARAAPGLRALARFREGVASSTGARAGRG
jgi:ABC-type Fe3+-hydroxamate transport system substrate-binding protein